MIKSSILSASLGAFLLIGGCTGTQNRGLESVHQPVVSRADYSLDLATAGGRLARGEPQRLDQWMSAMRLGFGDRVAIDDPQANAPLVREQVAAVVAHYGLLVTDAAPVTNAPVTEGTVRIVVSRMRADVPHCPDWSRDSGHDQASNTSSNYGCAMNANLAAMVARPEDLVHGQSSDETTDPVVSGRAITAFRKAAPSGGGGTTVKAESTGGK